MPSTPAYSLALESQVPPQRSPACASPLCGLPRWPVSTGRVLGSHLLWAAVRSFIQVRSPLTAAWCSGKAPSRVSSVAVWPSRSNHSTSAGWPNRAARCNGETPEASWSYRDISRMLSLGRPQGSLAGHHQHGQLTEAGLLDDPVTPTAGSLAASSIPTLTEEEAGLHPGIPPHPLQLPAFLISSVPPRSARA